MLLAKYSRAAPIFSGEDSISYYVRAVNQLPLLLEEDELAIADLWIREKNKKAGDILVNCHLRLVVKIASTYEGYDLSRTDLIGEGNMGLMLALQNFSLGHGARFSTYATWWIHAQIKQYILQNWSMIKIGTTRAQKLLFFSFRRLKAKIQGNESKGSMTEAEIMKMASEMGVADYEVRNMEARLERRDFSLNTPTGNDEDDEGEFIDFLEDSSPNPEAIYINKNQKYHDKIMALNLLDRLNAREKQIIAERILKEKPMTLEILGARFGISRERVRQIEALAIRKMQAAVVIGNMTRS